MKNLLISLLWALASVAPGFSGTGASDLSIIQVGHWLEVRGELTREGAFEASRVELMDPQRHELLIGTVGSAGGDEFLMLGQPVRLSEKTDWEGVEPSKVRGRRLKVEGHYRRRDKFSAREISARGPGRERLGGRVNAIRKTAGGLEVQIMRYTVRLPEGLAVEHETPWQEIALAPADAGLTVTTERDEDDLFGEGYQLGEALLFTAQVEVRSTTEENFDLDDQDREDRVDDEGSARLRLEWAGFESVAAQLEGRFRYRYRDDEEDGISREDSAQLGETFLHFKGLLPGGVDLVVGRQDFDEPREWLYDQNLDGLRLVKSWRPIRVELSATTSLSDASQRDREATNYIVYLSNGGADRHLAGYAIHRDFDLAVAERTTHVGARFLGDWLPRNRSWLEIAYLDGNLEGRRVGGWGGDLGTTWTPGPAKRYSFTLGYAWGGGDRDDSTAGRTFRQTGLQDNNAKFGGVTSFRYYGELVDPELANLEVSTVAVGRRFARRTSLDLVAHYYRQVEPQARLVEAELDRRPDGVHPELGWELDAILGWRGRPELDLEVVGAYFVPGEAFPGEETALLAKIQLRYRI